MPGFVLVGPTIAIAGAVPRTTEYDAPLVSPTNPRDVLLGTEHGLFLTSDGGARWQPTGLRAASVTALVQSGGSIIAGGNGLLAGSDNGGKSWVRLRPTGLPDEQIDALAANPHRPSEIYVLLDNFSLYRSLDGMRSFRLVSLDVGAANPGACSHPEFDPCRRRHERRLPEHQRQVLESHRERNDHRARRRRDRSQQGARSKLRTRDLTRWRPPLDNHQALGIHVRGRRMGARDNRRWHTPSPTTTRSGAAPTAVCVGRKSAPTWLELGTSRRTVTLPLSPTEL